jgi:hypothetical protein
MGIFNLLAISEIVEEPRGELTNDLFGRALRLLVQIEKVPPHPVTDRPPVVLLDERQGADPKGQVVGPQLPELRDKCLEYRRDTDCLVDAGADVAESKLECGIEVVRSDMLPNIRRVGDRVRLHQHAHDLLVARMRLEGRRHPGAREVSPLNTTVRLGTGHPKWRTRR